MSSQDPVADAAIAHIRALYDGAATVPLHAPLFVGNEKNYLAECVDTTFVSSVGKFVDEFERRLASLCKTRRAVAVVNGTQALYAALYALGVGSGDVVITQALTFVATANAINSTGAKPVFIDVDEETLGMSPEALERFLEKHCRQRDGKTFMTDGNASVKACVPMHTFGHPCRIEGIAAVCARYGIEMVEDAAESLGSKYRDRPCGSFGRMGILSFNGNKTITTGGGGAIISNDEALADRLKHLTTTAKVPHRWRFFHDEPGFNFRMPNINAALGCAQLERLPELLDAKRRLAADYERFFSDTPWRFIKEPEEARSNYWLNAVILPNTASRDAFLARSNDAGIQTRPCWELMHELPFLRDCMHDGLPVSRRIAECLVNLPSGITATMLA